ncbi:hypothetical protein [Thermosulfurimonas sp. F29]|uniref:hypothetical protein n=1 Tax=Thermosulfurimonas sp. F29 TaxID=2867247 RepID=UPI001C83B56A|nr:hypothetical protein [Thermosulfurimonas sp. F29]MBX6423274.1 hypothetical protein [Thermosulfurimonas sp. F29]
MKKVGLIALVIALLIRGGLEAGTIRGMALKGTMMKETKGVPSSTIRKPEPGAVKGTPLRGAAPKQGGPSFTIRKNLSTGSEKTGPVQLRARVINTRSDLSLERVYLAGCNIHVVIRNRGKGAVSDEDYRTGRLVVELKPAVTGKEAVKARLPKTGKHTFTLKNVDPKRMLRKPGARVDFDTRIKCAGRISIKISLEGFKKDGSAGRKYLYSALVPPLICTPRALSSGIKVTKKPSSVGEGEKAGLRGPKQKERIAKGRKITSKTAVSMSRSLQKARSFSPTQKELKPMSRIPGGLAGRGFKPAEELKGRTGRIPNPVRLIPYCGNGEFTSPKHGATYYYRMLGVMENTLSLREQGSLEWTGEWVHWKKPCAYSTEGDYSEFDDERYEYNFSLVCLDDGKTFTMKHALGFWAFENHEESRDYFFRPVYVEGAAAPASGKRFQVVVNVVDRNSNETVATYRSGIFRLLYYTGQGEFSEEEPSSEQPTVFTIVPPVVLEEYRAGTESQVTRGEVNLMRADNVVSISEVGLGGGLVLKVVPIFKTRDGSDIAETCGNLEVKDRTKMIVFVEKEDPIYPTDVVVIERTEDLSPPSYDWVADGSRYYPQHPIIFAATMERNWKQVIFRFELEFCGRRFEVPHQVVVYRDRDEAHPMRVYIDRVRRGDYLSASTTNYVEYHTEGYATGGCFRLYVWNPLTASWELLHNEIYNLGRGDFSVNLENLKEDYVGRSVKLRLDWCSLWDPPEGCKCEGREEGLIDSYVREFPFRNIVVLAPTQGEEVLVNTDYVVRWASSDRAGQVEIYFCQWGSGDCFLRARIGDTGSYVWHVREEDYALGARGATIKVKKISNGYEVVGESKKFRILPWGIDIITPAGGERISRSGTSYTLIWDLHVPPNKVAGKVKLYYRTRAPREEWSQWQLIDEVSPEQETYTWRVGDLNVANVQAQVKVECRTHVGDVYRSLSAVSEVFEIVQ